MVPTKRDWILAALKIAPLDRVRLMKALFLLWKRSGMNIPEYFEFQPYLYGPYSFDVYTVLDELLKQGLLVQPLHTIQQWAKYYLTREGEKVADEASACIAPSLKARLEEVVREVTQLEFYELLRRVYQEAPEFAVNSVARDVLR